METLFNKRQHISKISQENNRLKHFKQLFESNICVASHLHVVFQVSRHKRSNVQFGIERKTTLLFGNHNYQHHPAYLQY